MPPIYVIIIKALFCTVLYTHREDKKLCKKITKNNKIVSYKNQIKRLKDIKNKYKRTKCWKKLQKKKIVSNFTIMYFNMIYVKSYNNMF